MFLFVRCFIHSTLALSQALRLLRHSSLTTVVLDVLVIHMYMYSLYAVYVHSKHITSTHMGKYIMLRPNLPFHKDLIKRLILVIGIEQKKGNFFDAYCRSILFL